MAQHSRVPEFGNWESGENVPYTAYFENARSKSKRSLKMNPNNPREKLDKLSNNGSPVQALPLQTETKSRAQNGQEAMRKKHVRSPNQEDGNQWTSDSSQNLDTMNQKVSTNFLLRHDGSTSSNGSSKKAIQQGIGSDHRVEHSASHQNHQTIVGGKGSGVSSHSQQRKESTHGSIKLARLTPGKSQPRPVTQGNGMPDHSVAVPKFGDWDVTNPASANKFSLLFEKVREEKQNGSVPSTQNSQSKGQKQRDSETFKSCCCFTWSK